jgi:hypothetical protein
MSVLEIQTCTAELIAVVSAKDWKLLPDLLDRHRTLIQNRLVSLGTEDRRDILDAYRRAVRIARSHRAFLQHEFNHNQISAAILSAYDAGTPDPVHATATRLG